MMMLRLLLKPEESPHALCVDVTFFSNVSCRFRLQNNKRHLIDDTQCHSVLMHIVKLTPMIIFFWTFEVTTTLLKFLRLF